jgi:hypothetical protein
VDNRQRKDCISAAAYVLDRAAQYDPNSGVVVALENVAESLAKGEHIEARKCGELDALIERVGYMRERIVLPPERPSQGGHVLRGKPLTEVFEVEEDAWLTKWEGSDGQHVPRDHKGYPDEARPFRTARSATCLLSDALVRGSLFEDEDEEGSDDE